MVWIPFPRLAVLGSPGMTIISSAGTSIYGNFTIVVRVIVTLLVTPTGPPFAR
jgi:hypothetical protein